jgi:2-polyprenyl-3-methyl-5-hydroxy-6-metoxy-1,4-benzoquinol methylase
MDLTCNLCNGSLSKELLKINKPDRFEGYMNIRGENYERVWAECEACGVAVNNMLPDSLEAIRKIGTGYSEADNLDTIENIQKRFDKILSLPEESSDNVRRVKRIIDFSNSWFSDDDPVHIIDIGTGMGVFPVELQKQAETLNVEVTALDTDPLMTEHLRSLKRFEVVESLFPYENMPNHFDLITLNKVLEHIENPVTLLRDISRHIHPERGLFYLEVPCISNIWLKPVNDNSLGSIHFNLYTIFGLSRLLHGANLSVLEAKRITEPSGKITVYALACHKDAFQK